MYKPQRFPNSLGSNCIMVLQHSHRLSCKERVNDTSNSNILTKITKGFFFLRTVHSSLTRVKLEALEPYQDVLWLQRFYS